MAYGWTLTYGSQSVTWTTKDLSPLLEDYILVNLTNKYGTGII